jgi:hypothetical protein
MNLKAEAPPEDWEEIMAVSVAHLVHAQDSLARLRRMLAWPHGAGISYEAACRGLATALVSLEECGLLYWLARHDTAET